MCEKIELENVERAYSIMKECSIDSQHYLSFNKENMYFFGSGAYGVIPYSLAGKKAMSLGDPVCKLEDLECLTGEYIAFCKEKGYKPIFNSVSSSMIEILKKFEFSVIKYGEEAILELLEYTLSGSQRATLRRNVSKVDKRGVTLQEYKPKIRRDYVLENKITELSNKWFANKKFKLTYTVGSLNFDEPHDRRYFITLDERGNLLTVLSFLPYDEGESFCIDVMHRKLDTMTGVMEHAIILAAMKLKEDGVRRVSLGIAPLAGIDIGKPNVSRVEKLMNSIFNNMNSGYNFKNLYRFKKKFGPNMWKPRYLAYHNGISLVNLAMSITNTKSSSVDLILYAKYKFLFIVVTFFPWYFKDKNK